MKFPQQMQDRIDQYKEGFSKHVKHAWTHLKQDSGYGEYEGSLDDVIQDVISAWRNSKIIPFSLVVAVFPDYALIHQYATWEGEGDCPNYPWYDGCATVDYLWKVPYKLDEATDSVKFSDAIRVRLRTSIEEVTAASVVDDNTGGEGEDEEDPLVVIVAQSAETTGEPSDSAGGDALGKLPDPKPGAETVLERVAANATQFAPNNGDTSVRPTVLTDENGEGGEINTIGEKPAGDASGGNAQVTTKQPADINPPNDPLKKLDEKALKDQSTATTPAEEILNQDLVQDLTQTFTIKL